MQLQRVKQMLKNQLDETAMKKKEVSSEQEELTVQDLKPKPKPPSPKSPKP